MRTTLELDGSSVVLLGAAWKINSDLMQSLVLTLEASSCDQLLAALELLSVVGSTLGRPLVDAVSGSKFGHVKELRSGVDWVDGNEDATCL